MRAKMRDGKGSRWTRATRETGSSLMQAAQGIRIPLRNRHGEIVAHALIDDEDAALAEHRWHVGAKGYATRTEGHGREAKGFRLHREIIGLERGDKRQVDHKNRDRLDCRRSNLRVVPLGANQQNRSSVRGSSSRYRGVYWSADVGKWRAVTEFEGQKHTLGYFAREEDAAAESSAWRAEHMPYSIEVTA